MSRLAYTVILTLAMPVLILRLLWRSLRMPAYRARIGERFALHAPQFASELRADARAKLIWIHAVSVGEVAAAEPLIKALLQEYPDLCIVLTTMTPTGSQRAESLLGQRVSHCYVPYDLPFLLSRFIRALRPDLVVLMETELWPNLIHACHRRDIPLLLANGRLSAKSAQNYRRIAGVARQMLSSLNRIGAQSQDDADRFVFLGAGEHRVMVTGSLKFQLANGAAAESDAPIFAALKAAARPIVIAASTREGEEGKVLDGLLSVWQSRPEVLLLLVPRHPQRFDEVAKLCVSRNLKVQRRSEFQENERGLAADIQVLLGDSMGEMPDYYRCADIAFVGGSLVDTGCQNVLEPAALAIPVITGPSQYNFAAICRQLEEAGALHTVDDEQALARHCLELLDDPDQRAAMGSAGKALVDANQQALPAHLSLVAQLLV
ncbi:MAG: lipid IV(A) 3-deoxy-D-manno-octulosonic acid transferase [Pseudohongiellaceae bacterium]